MTSTLVIPSLGAATLEHCLAAVTRLDPGPAATAVVLSGAGAEHTLPAGVVAIRSRRRLGFAPAIDAGLAAVAERAPFTAVLNDDAMPDRDWLGRLEQALSEDGGLAAVQGSICDADCERIDGRGIGFDRWGLAIQLDRGDPAAVEPLGPRPIAAVSGTAALLRVTALDAVRLADGTVLDRSFGSYYEDVDLGLRLARLGWRAAWVSGATVRHLGSATGRRLPWLRPRWLLANRWLALAGNLTPVALLAAMPRLVRGELRALATLTRDDPRALAVWPMVAVRWPLLVARGWRRDTRGPRLRALPGSP